MTEPLNGENSSEIYILELYVTGMSPRSIKAIENVKAICEEYLKGRCKLEIIDLYKNPSKTETEDIIAVPTLLKKSPLPKKRIIGDLSDRNKVLQGLSLI